MQKKPEKLSPVKSKFFQKANIGRVKNNMETIIMSRCLLKKFGMRFIFIVDFAIIQLKNCSLYLRGKMRIIPITAYCFKINIWMGKLVYQ